MLCKGQWYTIVGTPNHHDAIIALKTVYLVQKEALHFISDQAVDILEYQQAWCLLSRFYEYLANQVMWTVAAC